MVKGIIFDFNGTLFWDSKIHEKAWYEFALKYADKQLNGNDFKNFIHGRINHDIIEFIFDKKMQQDEIQNYSAIKETVYREYLAKNRELLILAPGASELLDYLSHISFPYTIATSAEISNVEFYFKNLNLGKWFDISSITYDNGEINPKPAPDIFLNAAKKINQLPEDCLVVEDSVTGISAAHKAHVNKIIYVENDDPVDFREIENYVSGKINNFLQLKTYLNVK